MRLLAILMVLMLAACSGPAEKESTTDISDSVDDSVDEPDEPSDAVSDALSDLKSALGVSPKYTATYEITSGGETHTMTQVIDLPRFAVRQTVEGQESHMIMAGNKVIMCSNSGDWQCLELDSADSSAPFDPEQFKASVDDDADVSLAGTCSRAGEKGVKYKVVADGATSTSCVTKDGIMLEVSSSFQGQSMSMVATKVSRSVNEKDFTPEAEPIDMADFQAQMMQQYS